MANTGTYSNTGLTLHQTINTKENRRSAESQRTLSVILPNHVHRSKRSNSIITKLLANLETLSAVCLKESKFNEAAQIVKMYASNPAYAESMHAFAYRQIVFHSIHEQTLAELCKLKRSSDTKRNGEKILELSMQSMEVAKITDHLLEFENESELFQCIFLTDILTVSKFDLTLSSNLVDYARIKLNQYLMKSSSCEVKNKETCESTESNFNETSVDSNAFSNELKLKLSRYIESCQFFCSQIMSSGGDEEALTQPVPCLSEFLFDLNGVSYGLNSKNLLHNENIQVLVGKYKQFEAMKRQLNKFKAKLELQLAENSIEEKHEIYTSLMNLINESIRLNDNENLISNFFYKPYCAATTKLNGNSQSINFFHGSYDLFLNSTEKQVAAAALSNSETGNLRMPSTLKDQNEDSSASTSTLSSTNWIAGKSSNYLLSFYEYCRILYEYFKEKSSSIITVPGTYFSILDSSPASLICKLIFEGKIINLRFMFI